ncbi:spore coat U domain-containing protein [Phyllobacterium sp. OV277]|uniref:Csu type fimbrial protein n=1 Tax=Phyllobacterium sp. OV277 TaxID=1882772 RepID=UPI0008909541|nr:spore coat U domain-containing protein [Phyllobacterium sp. OV277]SDP80211.1 Spore coat protein U (SCPU) domain-containing protein [Phyllobacterium sp. OV277]
MKIKIALSLLFSLIPALVFPLILALGMFSFVQPSFAKNCHLTSPLGISTSIDLFASPPTPVTIPKTYWTCERDIPLKQWTSGRTNVCYRIEPVGSQIRDNYSFNLTMKDKPNVVLGFKLSNSDYGFTDYVSTNNPSLDTFGYGILRDLSQSLILNDEASRHHIPDLQVKLLLDGSQDLIQAGTYAGSYRVWIYQEDNYQSNTGPSCINRSLVSKSMLGMMDISITVEKNCLLGNQTDINFGTIASSVAMKRPEAEGNISIRCTTGTPYSIALDQGRYSVDGKQRQMKSADGKSFVAYELCADRGCNTPWTSTPIQIGQGEPMSTTKTTPIYARLPKLPAAPPAGVYRDTVVYTVTF